MDLGLKDKVVLITDGATEVGQAIAAAFVAEGASVAVCGRDAAALAAVQGVLKDTKGTHLLHADLEKPADVARVVAEVTRQFGRIDVVVNNFGAELPGTLDQVQAEQIDKMMHRKLVVPWELARAVAPQMRAREHGRFIQVINDAGKIPRASALASAMAGAAQHAFVKSLSDDLGRSNVLVSGVTMGHIANADGRGDVFPRDPNVSRSLGQQEAGWAADVPLGRWGKPADVAAAVVFLGSDLSSFICGSNIDVDGGDQRSVL